LWAGVVEPREGGLLVGGEVGGGLEQEPADLPRGIGTGLRRSRAALFDLAAMAVARPAPGGHERGHAPIAAGVAPRAEFLPQLRGVMAALRPALVQVGRAGRHLPRALAPL